VPAPPKPKKQNFIQRWLAKRAARRMQQEHGLEFPLVEASAEDVPLPDASFDLAFSEYGASIWCDPYRWIPEAARMLRPGGRLVFLGHSTLIMLTFPDDPNAPAGEQLLNPYFGMHRFMWGDDPSVEFTITHGEMIRLLHASGFEIEDLIEIQAPPDAVTPADKLTDAEWAQKWPSEEVWKARKRR